MQFLEALDIREGDVVAAVGGGGKTFLVYTLAAEAAEAGHTAMVTTTTKMTAPERGPLPPLLLDESVDVLIAQAPAELERARRLLVSTGRGRRNRYLPLTPEEIARLHQAARPWVLTVEADGSAHRPFKAPAAHEPVIPECATLVVACAGMEVLGRPLSEQYVHRPELVAALTGQAPDSPVTAQTLATVLLHPDGGREGVPPGARFAVLLNGASGKALAQAREVGALILAGPNPPPVLLCRRDQADPVVELLPHS